MSTVPPAARAKSGAFDVPAVPADGNAKSLSTLDKLGALLVDLVDELALRHPDSKVGATVTVEVGPGSKTRQDPPPNADGDDPGKG